MTVDQAALGELVARLMDRIDGVVTDSTSTECEIGDVVLVVEILTEDESVVLVQSNQLRKHHLRGLLAEANAALTTNGLEPD